MTKGFYNLTSGVLSQTRRLDVIGNNMTNVTTPGFKAETYTDIPFEDVMLNRVGNSDKSNSTEIGTQTYILAPDQLYIDLSEVSFDITNLNLDFALIGEGYFGIQTESGTEYTRNGSFVLDTEGYLYLPEHGRVLGSGGQPIRLNTDQITADTEGRLFDANTNALIGQIATYTFANEEQLVKNPSGLFGTGGQAAAQGDANFMWKAVENSNVDLAGEMSRMLTAQRTLQSQTQVLKIYDQLITKATTEIGRMA